MAVVPRKRKGGKVVYGVLTSWPGGEPYWELVGANKREAQELDRKRRKEVEAGTFRPGELTGASTVAAYAALWMDKRSNRAADLDRVAMRGHVLSVGWFAKLPMVEVRPKHILRLIDELKAKGTLAPKTITNVMALVRVMFRDAAIDDVVAASPYVVPRGVLKRAGVKRTAYTPAELELLVSEAVGERERVWNVLAFFLGLRLGEVCGLRWGDWDETPTPLGAVSITRQYVDQVLKTERPRTAPVHPFVAAVLRAWRARWALHFLHQPGPQDYIVPMADGSPMTRSSAYKMWLRSCKAAGVTNRSVHSTRHTFITLTLRGGADRRIVERITHNPKQEIIDVYTTHEWAQFCEAVLCIDSARASKTASGSGPSGGNGGSDTPAGSSGLQDSPKLLQGSTVRVLESEPINAPPSGGASKAASKNLTDAEAFEIALGEQHGSIASRVAEPPTARITAEAIDEESADVG
jgi:integrase